ncbi:MAG: carboxypeptidase regulatory-like domain-containing protein [Planctomycetes bacterium]|nr:carboxypeptidase regulatory-like domain-containing protein [Planctomycetota bacterium]
MLIVIVLLLGATATWGLWTFLHDDGGGPGLAGPGPVSAEPPDELKIKRSSGPGAEGPGEGTAGVEEVGAGGAIHGRVVDTAGVAIAGAELIAGRRVHEVQIEGGFSARSRLEEATARRVRSDEDGRFVIDGLPRAGAGQGLVMAAAPGYRPGLVQGLEFPMATERELVLRLQPGRRLVLSLRDAESGRPVVDARALVAAMGHEEGDELLDRYLMQESRADGDGQARFDHLAPRRYRLRVLAPGYFAPPERILPAEVEKLTVDLRPAGIVFGRVVDARNGRGAEILELGARTLRNGATGDELPVLRGAAAAARLGIEVVPGLFAIVDGQDPDLVIEVRASGLAAGRFTIPELTSGERRQVDLELPAEAQVAGRVLAANGEPVAAARVSASTPDLEEAAPDVESALLAGEFSRVDPRGRSPAFRPRLESEAITDAEGRYRLQGLAAGSYRLQASARGHRPGAELEILLEEAARLADVDLDLMPAGALAGQVLDASGKAVAGVEVACFMRLAEVEHAAFEGLFQDFVAELRTDAEGRFLFEGLAPGPARVEVQVVSGGRARKVEIEAGGTTEVLIRLEATDR